jgi:AcrR family transcriptional regulator
MKKGEQTRMAIIEQALNRASIVGLGGLSIGGLATDLDMSKSGLFAHFGSKEALQESVLSEVVDRFIDQVIRPALKESTGLAKVRALMDSWLGWGDAKKFPGGCPLMSASIEFDDQPGPLRDYVAKQQADWLGLIEKLAARAITDGDFRDSLDLAQFAFEFNAIGLGFNYSIRLHNDARATQHARTAFDRLISNASA